MQTETAYQLDETEPENPASVTADAFLRHWAQQTPDARALSDAPNRGALGLGTSRNMSFAAANRIVDRIAQNFAAHGLQAGDVLALQLPNVCEATLIIAGAWRAGLVPCTLPLLWRLTEIDTAFGQVEPAAVVCMGRSVVSDNAETMREVAAQHVTVRFIFGLGVGLPDGVTPIDHWLEEAPSFGGGPAGAAGALHANAPAVLTWSTTPAGTFAVPRTHGELIDIGKVFVGRLGLSNRDTLLNTYPLSTITAIGGQLMPWLLTGASLTLHQPFEFAIFLDQLAAQDVTYTAIPAPVIAALAEDRHLSGQGRCLTRIGCVWPASYRAGKATELSDLSVPLFDIHNFSELALMVRQRDVAEDPMRLPLGKQVAPSGSDEPTVYLETRVRGSVRNGATEPSVLKGELLVRGTTVPHGPFNSAGIRAQTALRPDAHGYLDTEILCSVDESVTGHFRCERNEGLIQHGGVAVAASELDALYSDFPDFLDVAAFAIDCPVMGDRIVAAVVPRPEATPSLDQLKQFLGTRQVAGYKVPDQIVVVNAIPRRPDGQVMRDQILAQV
ncbi:MAG: class I adenylate-forming enzyme family protein [Methyloligellaceae bacterium]